MIVGLMSNQQTFIDMTDSQNLSISIAYNLPVVQVKNNSENPATYSPSWETTNLILTPTVFLNSADVTTSIESITWKRQDGGATPVNLISGETVSNGILTVSTNNLSTSSSGIITYICTATTADGLTATEKVSFSLIVSGATSTSENASVTFQLYAPNGYVLSNTIESITLQTVAYVGSTQIQTGEATYRWYEQNDAEWSLIQEGTSSSYIVTRDDVNKFKNYKCDMIYNGNTYTATIMVEDKSDTYNKDNHTLYVLTSKYNSNSDEIKNIKKELDNLKEEYKLVYELDSDITNVPISIIIFAFSILLIILLIMCSSWIEPVLFIITIGIAIIINLGTNYLLGEVSYTTYSIAAILQLVLTMDYSIMLLNRYREEKENNKNNLTSMKEAIKKSFLSIMGSSFTTIVGLLALLFMSFKIGIDLGIVLSKGVLISLICIFTVLPSLILIFDKLIYKTHKKCKNFSLCISERILQ